MIKQPSLFDIAGRFWPRVAFAAMSLLCFTITHAAAQSDDLAALFAPGTVYSVGMLTGAGPRFQGARRAALWGLPYASFRRVDEAPEWWSPDDALDTTLFDAGPVHIGPALDFREGRSARDLNGIAGVPTLPLTVGLGLFGELWLVDNRVRLRAEITQGLRPHDGIVAKLGADLIGRFGRFTLSGGPRFVLADTAAMRLDFDVPLRAALSPPDLLPYRAKAGLRSAGGSTSLAYDWSDAWQTLVYVRYDRLVSEAARSPIVRRLGTTDQLSFGIGGIYTFRTGP